MARIANKYLPIHQLDPNTPNLFLAQLIGAKDFRRDVLLRVIYEEKEWETALLNAKKCAHLHHSNILQTLDVGQHNDFWYVAYEFVESLTLEEVLSQKIELSSEHIVFICTEILKALHYAQTQHTEPVYHNNLEPNQILITKQGSIKIRGFSVKRSSEVNEKYTNPTTTDSQKQDLYSVGKLLETMNSQSKTPNEELLRIASQACSQQSEIQFRSPKAMYDILLLRFPLKGTTSNSLASQILTQSFDEWEEQPTFISRTLTIKDTQVFIAKELLEEEAPETFPLETKIRPPTQNIKQSLPNNLKKTTILVVVATLLLGMVLGYTLHPSPSFKALVPKGLTLRANDMPFSEISQQSLDSEIKLEILQDQTVVNKTTVTIEPNQNLIIILPLETTSKPTSP